MKKADCQRIIIGGGPAGISAAITFAENGIKSVIIDENADVGGVIYRQATRKIDSYPFANDITYRRGCTLINKFMQHQDLIEFKANTQVVGTMDDSHKIIVCDKQDIYEMYAEHFIVATGCYERVQPFPGWNLPGVMGLGGVQLQIKRGFVKPGKSVVLVGTGPLLLVAAKQLHAAGVPVKAVFEAGRLSDLIKNTFSLLHNIPLLTQGLMYHLYLKMHHIPFKYGWGIVEARGDETVHSVVVAPYDKQWRPNREKTITLETDCLGINYGFACRSHLTQMMGCQHLYHKNSGGYQPKKDDWMRTSKIGVYVAGDSAGFNGAEVAELEGKIAALGSMLDNKELTSKDAKQLVKPINKKLSHLLRFRVALEKFSALKPGLLDLPTDDTLICRCENITYGRIKQAMTKGIKTETSLKMSTRLGMGDCQGKICGPFSSEFVSNNAHYPLSKVGVIRPRFPLFPVPFSRFKHQKNEKK